MYLCGDTHAARNVHTENHHSVFYILVVVIVLGLQVEVIAHAYIVNSVCACAAVGHPLFTIAEFTCPYLEKKGEKLLVVVDILYNIPGLEGKIKDLMCFPEKPKVLQGKKKKFNYYSHFSSQDSHMTRRHYISHKRLGSAHSPGLQLVGDGEKSQVLGENGKETARERVCVRAL